jgi:GNAT superfamily N-acetyltransferase
LKAVLEAALGVYELVRDEADDLARLREEIAAHTERGTLVAIHHGGRVTGMAFAWLLRDLYDLKAFGGYPGDDFEAPYAFLPLIYIHPDFRGWRSIKTLLETCLRQFSAVRRIAFKRHPRRRLPGAKRPWPRDGERFHILFMKD